MSLWKIYHHEGLCKDKIDEEAVARGATEFYQRVAGLADFYVHMSFLACAGRRRALLTDGHLFLVPLVRRRRGPTFVIAEVAHFARPLAAGRHRETAYCVSGAASTTFVAAVDGGSGRQPRVRRAPRWAPAAVW
ncbi:hypothetical protein V2A60_006914 [Cordyceps javanica]|uniref:Oxalocrotonate tautomerase enzyme domain-containing protein n=1 Tax=Cordyceps javanica TaxID=43265 RepID=A0A545VKI4_9HYPO|nr:oxalocrotonate tautomerase enzyme domain-containing protein [Cordyceps javanica]TQW02247.1 oxalocrotonate tautomerase enzyme domain-containing protein [Cordyceps javanica]